MLAKGRRPGTEMAKMPDDPHTLSTLEAVRRFNEAFDRRDVRSHGRYDRGLRVREHLPAPRWGTVRGTGPREGVLGTVLRLFPDARFTAEEIFAAADRCVVRWRYDGKARTERAAISAAWTSSASATGKWPRNSPTSRGDHPRLPVAPIANNRMGEPDNGKLIGQ